SRRPRHGGAEHRGALVEALYGAAHGNHRILLRLYTPSRCGSAEIHVRVGAGRMTLPVQPMPALFLPDNAPFTPEQRSWLNGFFAGLIALDSGATPVAPPSLTPLSPAQHSDDGEAPWHDQTLALPERMQLAEGR